MGKWTYHKSHSYKTAKGEEVSFQTQLYKVGVYGIVNGDPAMQVSITPSALVKLERKLNKQLKAGTITDLVFRERITVSSDTGFYEEVE